MPYITEQRKQQLAEGDLVRSFGELTFLLTESALDVVRALNQEERDPEPDLLPAMVRQWNEHITKFLPASPRYDDYAVVLGCIDSTVREFKRREWAPDLIAALERFAPQFYAEEVAPYEDQKIVENGDVTP